MAEEKFTAVYLMVRQEELRPEDQGSYERPLAEQKEACLALIQEKLPPQEQEPVSFYTRRSQLFMDMERKKVKRLVVYEVERLAANRQELEGILFECRSAGIPILSVR
ncbi:recombinase family protein [Desulfosoma caldarium]|uniref:Resolvase-like protein n=1 Tax=Desulfosoma caldarium TaxID=610254 RepID=A0A3N1UR98_9BACT|nr:recombinase family protein [Desulfosoma caldarium]ROQ89566.1 resolvase-like protein [Desulfosoma caldarium]